MMFVFSHFGAGLMIGLLLGATIAALWMREL